MDYSVERPVGAASLAIAVAGAAWLVGCATPSTVFVGPPCAQVSSPGAEQLTPNSVVVPSTGVPFSSRVFSIKYPDGREETHVVTSDKIDALRLELGLCCLAVGGFNLTGYALVRTDPATANVWLGQGLGATAAAALLLGLGWEPDQRLMAHPGACEEHTPSRAVPPASARTAPSATAAPPAAPR